MLVLGRFLVGIAIVGGFITLLITSHTVRYFVIDIIKNCWFIPVILVLLAIFANKWFMLIYNNATKISLFIMFLGIIGMGTSSGRKMIIPGGLIALIGYFILPTF